MIAASMGHVRCLRAILRLTADLDARDFVGATALMMAAQNGIEEATSLLLRCRADPSLRLGMGGHATAAAAAASTTDTAGDGLGSTALHVAASNGHKNVVRLLLRYDPGGLHSLNAAGNTPLHEAAERGHAEVVTALLEVRIDTDSSNACSAQYTRAIETKSPGTQVLMKR